MRTSWNFHSAGQLVFGRGAVKQLGSLVERRKFRRALVVTDERLIAAGLADRVVQPLTENGLTVEVFRGGEPEPAIETAGHSTGGGGENRGGWIFGLGGGGKQGLAKVYTRVAAHC